MVTQKTTSSSSPSSSGELFEKFKQLVKCGFEKGYPYVVATAVAGYITNSADLMNKIQCKPYSGDKERRELLEMFFEGKNYRTHIYGTVLIAEDRISVIAGCSCRTATLTALVNSALLSYFRDDDNLLKLTKVASKYSVAHFLSADDIFLAIDNITEVTKNINIQLFDTILTALLKVLYHQDMSTINKIIGQLELLLETLTHLDTNSIAYRNTENVLRQEINTIMSILLALRPDILRKYNKVKGNPRKELSLIKKWLKFVGTRDFYIKHVNDEAKIKQWIDEVYGDKEEEYEEIIEFLNILFDALRDIRKVATSCCDSTRVRFHGYNIISIRDYAYEITIKFERAYIGVYANMYNKARRNAMASALRRFTNASILLNNNEHLFARVSYDHLHELAKIIALALHAYEYSYEAYVLCAKDLETGFIAAKESYCWYYRNKDKFDSECIAEAGEPECDDYDEYEDDETEEYDDYDEDEEDP